MVKVVPQHLEGLYYFKIKFHSKHLLIIQLH